MTLPPAERVPYITAAIAFLGLVSGLVLKGVLVIGDGLFRFFWRRNKDFAQQQIAETFGPQLNKLARIPDALDNLASVSRETTRAVRAIGETQRMHGEQLAAVSMAVQFAMPPGVDLDHPLRRHFARRATDPRPTDAEQLEQRERPLQAEDVGGGDDHD